MSAVAPNQESRAVGSRVLPEAGPSRDSKDAFGGLDASGSQTIRHQLLTDSVYGQNSAAPEKPWNDDSLVNAKKQWSRMDGKWCETGFVYPR